MNVVPCPTASPFKKVKTAEGLQMQPKKGHGQQGNQNYISLFFQWGRVCQTGVEQRKVSVIKLLVQFWAKEVSPLSFPVDLSQFSPCLCALRTSRLGESFLGTLLAERFWVWALQWSKCRELLFSNFLCVYPHSHCVVLWTPFNIHMVTMVTGYFKIQGLHSFSIKLIKCFF